MFAIPVIIFDNGFVHQHRGDLLNPPAELFSPYQMSFYSNCKVGWQRCPLGYHAYAQMDSLGRKTVFPAIALDCQSAPSRKFPSYPLRFSKDKIEAYARGLLGVSTEIRSQRDEELLNLAHDLRAAGTEIYHSALNAKKLAEQISDANLHDFLEVIVNAQQMMSLRLDIIDYESGLSSTRPRELIGPRSKIDKVIRSFSGKMRSRNITWRVQGNCTDFLIGPPIFEIVPFVIIENALKYAPYGRTIVVRFEEGVTNVIIRFESMGPLISDKEKLLIFNKKYRGEAVQGGRTKGSGIGLFAAKTITETHFGGQIFVNQTGDEVWMDGTAYRMTRFTLILPTVKDNLHGERRGNFRRRS